MAAKAKAKKKAPKKATAKKAPAKRKRPAKKMPAGPAHVVENHRFAPGTKVSFHRVFEIGVERNEGRAPVPSPIKTATVKKDGTLEVGGLEKGMWVAAGPSGERFLWHQFSVGLS